MIYLVILLALAGDIEVNPGPQLPPKGNTATANKGAITAILATVVATFFF